MDDHRVAPIYIVYLGSIYCYLHIELYTIPQLSMDSSEAHTQANSKQVPSRLRK